jgi:peptide/nickel transport system ATP-binding protein
VVGLQRETGGRLAFGGRRIGRETARGQKSLASLMSMVFQNPDSTLNPKHRVSYAISRPLRLNFGLSGRELREATLEYLDMVRLGPNYAQRYPRELSGGEKQRVAIARALAGQPSLVVCDEPTSALDVSVQAAIIRLLLEIQGRLGLSFLFISHDLSVVRYFSDQVAVMYLGTFCETGSTAEVFSGPAHPYTQALWSAMSSPDPEAERHPTALPGSPPSLASPPAGCRFHTRCPSLLGPICLERRPPAVRLSDSHTVHCHRYQPPQGMQP